MSNLDLILKQQNLLKSIQYYRLNKEKEIINKEIAETNAKIDTSTKNVFKKLGNSINNSVANSKNNKLKEVEEFISNFEKDNSSYDYKMIVDNNYEAIIKELLTNDMAKVLLAMNIILDNSYEYDYQDEEYSYLSSLIFGNNEQLGSIKKKLQGHYFSITSNIVLKLSNEMTKALKAASAISVLDNSNELSIAKLAEVGIDGLSNDTYALAKLLAKSYDHSIDDFRLLNKEETGLLLTFKAFMIEEAKAKLSSDELKQELISQLGVINTLREDVNYMLFIERKELELNKAKLDYFESLDKRLIKILGLE